MNTSNLNIEGAVAQRYSQASQAAETALCCPVDYDAQWLQVLPQDLIDRDYGCGDPSKWVQEGDHVLDLGSGGGKICYIASQVVGQNGRVIGVDMNDDMLTLARQYQSDIVERIGWDNVRFHKGKIQDLQLNLDDFEAWLTDHPVTDANSWLQAEQQAQQLRQSSPMIENASVDVVVSNCVLNLVQPHDVPRYSVNYIECLSLAAARSLVISLPTNLSPSHYRMMRRCGAGASVAPLKTTSSSRHLPMLAWVTLKSWLGNPNPGRLWKESSFVA
ncbi:MAG: methyltransferase domain-containing protein [Pirellulales bacterium]|nr:methyltransferase domain-containing protein [Pirellulales bacterium]